MNILVDCPQSNAGEWRFALFGVLVRVKFWFWVSVLILCGAPDTAGVLIWVAVCLGSVLLHEFGHVLAFRLFGEQADIALYGWGGLTIPWHSLRGTLPRVTAALAGPAAGFCVAGFFIAMAWVIGLRIDFGWQLFFPALRLAASNPLTGSLLGRTLLFFAEVNFSWALVNLLPLYPLDGYHAAEAILEQRAGYGARRKALLLSTVTGGVMSAVAMAQRNLLLVLAFLVLALSSAQAMESAGRGTPRRPERPWRG